MSTATKQPVVIDIDLRRIGEFFRTKLNERDRPHYDIYLRHIADGDFEAAQAFADAYIDPLLWVDSTPSEYRTVRQAFALGEKVSMKGDLAAEERAWRKFRDTEAKCRRTNKKFRYLTLVPWCLQKHTVFHESAHLHLGGTPYRQFVVYELREIVSAIFGDLKSAYDDICSSVRYGKGMSLSSADTTKVSVPFKLSDPISVTRAARPVWRDFLNRGFLGLPGYVDWIRDHDGRFRAVERVKEVPGCRITFVDKTSVIKRTIAIEPSANITMQLAIHSYLARRLKKVGIDIHDQTKNRAGALEGSLTGGLATIDLSSASDLISFELVRWLVPKDWFDLLVCLRSPSGKYRDQVVVFEKFSSMGNGFTFALETVLFYAITKVACKMEGYERFNPIVYGDDIIVPSLAYNRSCDLLRWHGFKVNTKKSYNVGPFRESCGLDAFKGVDVRPVFIRNLQLSCLELIDLHNHCFQLFGGKSDICEYLASLLPKPLRLYGPSGPQAGFLFTEDHRKLRDFGVWNHSLQTYEFEALREEGVRTRRSVAVTWLLEAALLDGGRYSRGAPLRFRTKLVRYKAYRDIQQSLGTPLG